MEEARPGQAAGSIGVGEAAARGVAPGGTLLKLEGVRRHFGSAKAVDGVDLAVRRGEFFTLLGPSGCGKTTLLRLIAGFERPDEGRVLLDGVDLADTEPEHRPVHTVFQSYALFPHMTVAGNVAFPLRMAGVEPEERSRRVGEVLRQVGLEDLGNRDPGQLSGGQRQRVALARALVNRPRLLLLDEPLAALDLKLREQMQRELVGLQSRLGITFVYVTHDQGEALALSHRIAVMNAGRIEQLDQPETIYEHPASRFVASFIGNCNLLDGTVTSHDAGLLRIAVPSLGDLALRHGSAIPVGMRGSLAVRPEKLHMAAAAPPALEENRLEGRIREKVYLGEVTLYRVEVGGGRVLEALLPNSGGDGGRHHCAGDTVQLSWRLDAGRFLPA